MLIIMRCPGNNRRSEQESKDPTADSVYVSAGGRIVALTFDTLRNSLLGALPIFFFIVFDV